MFFGLAGLAIMAAAVTATVTSVNTNSTESNLLLQNLEALTQSEDGYYYNECGCPIFPGTCYGIVVTPSGNHGFECDYSIN